MLNFMKRFFHKKYLFFLLALIILFGPTLIVLAIETPKEQYRSYPKETKPVMSKLGTSTIINRSDKDLFVPNNTSPEYTAWSQKAPSYVSVSVCGDGVIYSKKHNIRSVHNHIIIIISQYVGDISYIC